MLLSTNQGVHPPKKKEKKKKEKKEVVKTLHFSTETDDRTSSYSLTGMFMFGISQMRTFAHTTDNNNNKIQLQRESETILIPSHIRF